MKRARTLFGLFNAVNSGIVIILRSVKNIVWVIWTMEYSIRKIVVAVSKFLVVIDLVKVAFMSIMLEVVFGNNFLHTINPAMPIVRSHQENEFPKISGGKGICDPMKNMGRNSTSPSVPQIMSSFQSFRCSLSLMSGFLGGK